MTEDNGDLERLADCLEQAANAYRNIASNEMSKSYGGSIDKIYDCVRNGRNLGNKARKVRLYGSTF